MRQLLRVVSTKCHLTIVIIIVTTVLQVIIVQLSLQRNNNNTTSQSLFVNAFSSIVPNTILTRRRQQTAIKVKTITSVATTNRNRYRNKHCFSLSSSNSIPFVVNDYYDNNNNDNDIVDDNNEITTTTTTTTTTTNNNNNNKLVIGINKYSHDTSICIADSTTGQILIALSKERIDQRMKHDSGNIASLIDICFDYLNSNSSNSSNTSHIYNIDTNTIHSIIMNNHHHRIIPYIENNIQHMEWESSLRINGGTEDGYDDIENTFLLDNDPSQLQQLQHSQQNKIRKIELSHHLAHAYSTICQSPSTHQSGLCFVFDGMGESYRTMMYNSNKSNNNNSNTNDYISDISFTSDVLNNVITIPSNINELITTSSVYDYREGESIYHYVKNYTSNTICIYPIFKRYIPETIPSTLYNHGFDSMTSVGAIYSRASTHIFGNWNSCGKVMGLAPWYNYNWNTSTSTSTSTTPSTSSTTTTKSKAKAKSKSNIENTNTIIQPTQYNERIMWGKLYSEQPNETFQYNRTLLEGIAFISRTDPDLFQYSTSKDDTSLTMKKRYDFDDQNENNNNQQQDQDINEQQKQQQKLPTKVALDAIGLANRIQNDIEDIVVDLVQHFVTRTNETNICLAGGVALNSVLNGKISRYINSISISINNNTGSTFISPYPGDDGIAIGCCAYGLFTNPYLQHNHMVPVEVQQDVNTTTIITTDDMNNVVTTKSNNIQEIEENTVTATATATAVKPTTTPIDTVNTATNVKYEPLQGLVTGVPLWKGPISPYQGPEYTQDDIQEAIDDAITYIDVEYVEDDNQRIDIMINELAVQGNVIALYNSRSEIGPRALGHRSILADPRKKSMVRFINEYVKKRESFRPFAPSVLAEYAHEWFNLFHKDDDTSIDNAENDDTIDDEIDRDSMATKNNISPYMSMTAAVPVSKRHLIPAVTHVDGSSRIQTVHIMDEPFYYNVIKQFYKKTGIPMLLNTSFNTIPKEPIVETPANAIRSFLYSQGTISLLVLDKYIIRRKKPNLQSLLGQVTKDGILIKEAAYPKRSGSVQYQSTFTLDETNNDNKNDNSSTNTITKVRMCNRILHCTNTNEWYELLDDLEGEILAICDGTVTLNDILSQYTTTTDDNDNDDGSNIDDEQNDNLLQNIIHRMVRLYDETLIGW